MVEELQDKRDETGPFAFRGGRRAVLP